MLVIINNCTLPCDADYLHRTFEKYDVYLNKFQHTSHNCTRYIWGSRYSSTLHRKKEEKMRKSDKKKDSQQE